MPQFLETHLDQFTISTDPSRLDVDAIADLLSRAYWAEGRTREMIARSLQHSLAFGVYDGARQIGLARVISDYTTFAYLCDVILHEDYRGQGLGKWLMATVHGHPDLRDVRRWLLATTDAHGLYRQFGWTPLEHPERLMTKSNG
jgi:GNAT superfamily N-acetyltransferase